MATQSTKNKSSGANDTSHLNDMIVVGELNMDLILDRVNNLPEIGKERISESMSITLGSSSAILASNAAALGLNIAFTGRVGNDLFGKHILAILKERELDTSRVLISENEQTGLTFIYTYRGDRGMVTYPGAMEKLTIDDIDWKQVASSRHLHMSSYYLQKGIRPDTPELFKKAKSLGLSTSFDTNWDPDEQWGDEIHETLKYVDVFLPNDAEAKLISKKESLEKALDFLASFGGVVVATCGSEGIVARDHGSRYHVSSIHVNPVDAVGAGDSFNAGFLSKYVTGEDLPTCLSCGVIAGAYSTLKAGGTASFQDMKRFRDFARQANPKISVSEAPV